MENDNAIQQADSLYPTLHTTGLLENLFELLGLDTCSFDKTVKEIGPRLHHKNWMVRLEAVNSLGVLGKQAEIVLKRMLDDENECVRLLAQYELQRLALKESSVSIPMEYTSQKASSCTEEYLLERLARDGVQRKESAKQKHRYMLTWRELLAVILEDSYALEKVITVLHISSETIMNWINYKDNPDLRFFQQILETFPDDYDAFLELIQREFPHFVPERLADDDAPREISAPFCDRLSKSLREGPPTLRFWSTCQFVLQQAVQQLDPYRTGMMAAIMICTAPSSGEKVRSLHGYLGLGSSMRAGNWHQQPLFFGSDSLSGCAVTVGKIQVIHDVKSDLKGVSFYDVDEIRSVLVVPILSAGKCAGCLYVTSPSPYHFCPHRIGLVQTYAEYLAQAFSPEEFYASEQMQLAVIPYKTQISYFKAIRKRSNHTTRDIFISRQDKQKDWKRAEEEIISFIRGLQEPVRRHIPASRPIIESGIQQARSQIEAEFCMLLSAIAYPESRQSQLA